MMARRPRHGWQAQPANKRACVAVAAVVVVIMVGAGCPGGHQPRSRYEQQVGWKEELEPARPRRPPPEQRGTVYVRAVVDADYERAWSGTETRAHIALDDASRLLEGAAGITLTIVDEQPWQGARRDESLDDALARLKDDDQRRASAGSDVVIGFLGSEPVLTSSLHRLGLANHLGRHAVVRATDDRLEAQAVKHLLHTLTADETDALLERRRRHKAAVVLAHEIVHLLGGVHTRDPNELIAPSYAPEQNRLGDAALALLEAGLLWHRAADDEGRRAAAAALASAVDGHVNDLIDGDWQPARAGFVARAGAPHARDAPDTQNSFVLAPDDAAVWNTAVGLSRAGRWPEAWALVRPLVVPDDAHGTALAFGCSLVTRPDVVALDGARVCARALAANPDDVDVAVSAVASVTRSTRGADDDAAFNEALARIARAPAVLPGARLRLAVLAFNADHLAVVEQVMAPLVTPPGGGQTAETTVETTVETTQARALLADVRNARGRLALRAGTVSSDDEPELIAALRTVRGAPDGDPQALLAVVDATEARFGKSAATLVQRCNLERRAKRLKNAESLCDEALALDGDAAVVHLVRAFLRNDQRRPAEAIREAQRTLALDPTDANARNILVALLRHAGRVAEADAVPLLPAPTTK